MKTTDLFTSNRAAQKLNETIEKTFGQRINFTSFDVPQLEDARNKLRTQVYQARSEAGFNETLDNDAFTKAQWILDAINAEIMERAEHIVELEESAPPTAKGERTVKHIKAAYGKDGKLTDKEKGIAYATAWKQHNKEKNESVKTGDNMTRLNEGEIQQASAIVNAKTMVDRVGRWIEELSGMENDTLLQLGDSIRDEMSQDLAKQFISQCAPAIQQALENLKTTRETLATGVRMLTGEEQSANMLGGEPGAEGGNEFGDDAFAEPADDMELGGGAPEDEFAASEPGAGGIEAAGREQRESINYQSRLLKVLAG